MFLSGVITFREALESLLVVSILFSYLVRTNQLVFKRFVIKGVLFGVVIALILSQLLDLIFGGLPEKNEPLFEGILLFLAAGFITWMILWVHRQKNVAGKLKNKLQGHIAQGSAVGIFFLAATSVMREGTEAVLYLKANSVVNGGQQLLGATLGIIVALLTGYAMFYLSRKLPLKAVFNSTSVLLLLFAAGMVGRGIHEFQELGMLPLFSIDPLFNASHVLADDTGIGSLLSTMFGYTSKPSILEVVGYGSYITFILVLQKITSKLLAEKTIKIASV